MLAKFKPWMLFWGVATAGPMSFVAAQTPQPSRQTQPVPPAVHIAPGAPAAGSGQHFQLTDSVPRTATRPAIEDRRVQPTAFQPQEGEPQVPAMLAGSGRLLPPNANLQAAKQQIENRQVPEPSTAPAGRTQTPPPAAHSGQPLPSATLPAAATPAVSAAPRTSSPDEFRRMMNENRLQANNPQMIPSSTSSSGTGSQPIGSIPVSAGMSRTNLEIPDGGVVMTTQRGAETKILELAIPTIEIETSGPPTVGIHKRAQYRLVVRNTSSRDAEQLTVSVNLPQWIKLDNVSTTVGRREMTTEQKQTRINWNIDRLSAGSSQTMTLDALPTRPENFDFGVTYSMQPRSVSSKIQVTEPRLDMSIAGPNEVMYGETANYQVTVRNPGTGLAENVTVMLPEALGGERASLGQIAPGQERTFQVELLARAAGQLDLTTTATGAGEIQTQATRSIVVRRPVLDLQISGPELKYSGSVAHYDITITNTGDAIARDVAAALALPPGVQYLEGIEGSELIESAMRWSLGTLDVGDKRTYRVAVQLNGEGSIQLDLGARGSSDTAAVDQCVTMVETVADLMLIVEDPKGPLPTGQKLEYVIRVKNRGSRAATDLNLVMQYSEGIEPTMASGLGNQVVPGQVIFSPITSLEPGQEMKVVVTAQALTAGNHRFRAQLSGDAAEEHEVAEGTTRFYGDTIAPKSATKTEPNAFGR